MLQDISIYDTGKNNLCTNTILRLKKVTLSLNVQQPIKLLLKKKLSDWINGVVKGEYVAPTENNTASIQEESPVSDKEQTEQEKTSKKRVYRC